jgi:sec-independent protein translocase protein TatA
MFGLRMPELIIIFAILILVFGAKRIPQLGESLGKTIRGFRKATEGKDDEPSAPARPAELPGSRAAATAEPAARAAEKA